MTTEYKNLTATLSCDKFRDKIWDYQRTMTALLRSTENPPVNAAIISTDDSETPIYLWGSKDKTTVYWYSEAEHPKLEEDCKELFGWCDALLDISGLADFDTSSVKNMTTMFSVCTKLKDLTPLSHWDTSNVTNLGGMFCNCVYLMRLNGLENYR